MTKKEDIDIDTLAKLARMNLSDEECAGLEKEIPAILKFVEQVQGVETTKTEHDPEHRNVMRGDGESHESGIYTDTLLNAAPDVEKGRVRVKQVIKKTL